MASSSRSRSAFATRPPGCAVTTSAAVSLGALDTSAPPTCINKQSDPCDPHGRAAVGPAAWMREPKWPAPQAQDGTALPCLTPSRAGENDSDAVQKFWTARRSRELAHEQAHEQTGDRRRAMSATAAARLTANDDVRMGDAVATLPVFVEVELEVDVGVDVDWLSPSPSPLTSPSAYVTAQDSPHDVSDIATATATTNRIKVERMELTLKETNPTINTDGERTNEMPDRRVNNLELKRLRNRECMRRARTRKMDELAAMKSEIAHLEQHLRTLQLERAAALALPRRVAQAESDSASELSDTDTDTHTHNGVDELQRENFALRDAIRLKEKLRKLVAPLLEQEEQRITLDAQQREHQELYTDQFAWLRHVLPLLKLKSTGADAVAALVRQSCDQIVASARRADASIESPFHVLGWSDKRLVDDAYVQFVFSKDFAHQRMDELATMSWETSSDLGKVSAFQPRAQRMVCLHRWDDDTVVLARNLHVAQRCGDAIGDTGGAELERNFCSVILLFRLRTATGIVVGTRTLQPDIIQPILERAGEFRTTYVDLCYGLLFTPLRTSDPTIGCNVRFGGRAGNGTRAYAQVCAMDVLLATLRWENHCIAPLNCLAR